MIGKWRFFSCWKPVSPTETLGFHRRETLALTPLVFFVKNQRPLALVRSHQKVPGKYPLCLVSYRDRLPLSHRFILEKQKWGISRAKVASSPKVDQTRKKTEAAHSLCNAEEAQGQSVPVKPIFQVLRAASDRVAFDWWKACVFSTRQAYFSPCELHDFILKDPFYTTLYQNSSGAALNCFPSAAKIISHNSQTDQRCHTRNVSNFRS